jgi:hypothetical protein
MGTYQYKIVLVCGGAGYFRNNNLDYALEKLNAVDINASQYQWQYGIKTQDDLDYGYSLHKTLSTLDNYTLRVESPWISIYSNSHKDIDLLSKINQSKVKYICSPAGGVGYDKNTIVMPKIDFDFKVTLGKTSSNYQSFVHWAENNSKIRLTKTCIRDLNKEKSWGGTYFYITGEKNLLMAKMHLGGCINKIERIVRS